MTNETFSPHVGQRVIVTRGRNVGLVGRVVETDRFPDESEEAWVEFRPDQRRWIPFNALASAEES